MQASPILSPHEPSHAGARPPNGSYTAWWALRFGVFLLWLLGAVAARAETRVAMDVDVELMLAVDVSYSMTAEELDIQRRGYAAALSDPAIWRAITLGRLQRVALTYVEWAGAGRQRIVIPWRVIDSEADLAEVASTLGAQDSSAMVRTSISSMLDAAPASFEANGFNGWRRVIDISGDGPNNQHRPVTEARDALVAEGYTINGLPLMTRRSAGWLPELDDLDLYYESCVIGGPLSFAIPVRSWQEFVPALRQKLVLELAGVRPAPRVVQAQWRGATDDGYDCLVGEKMWQEYMGDRFD